MHSPLTVSSRRGALAATASVRRTASWVRLTDNHRLSLPGSAQHHTLGPAVGCYADARPPRPVVRFQVQQNAHTRRPPAPTAEPRAGHRLLAMKVAIATRV